MRLFSGSQALLLWGALAGGCAPSGLLDQTYACTDDADCIAGFRCVDDPLRGYGVCTETTRDLGDGSDGSDGTAQTKDISDVAETRETMDGDTTDATDATDATDGADTVSPTTVRNRYAAGWSATCAIDLGGPLACWGANEAGRTIVADGPDKVQEPTSIASAETFSYVDYGADHACAVGAGGRVFCWGANDVGQLGLSDRDPRPAPTEVDLPVAVERLDNSSGHTCAVDVEGGLWCWGRNLEHELGRGTSTGSEQPARVPGEQRWSRVAAGRGATCAVTVAGELWCWGGNASGEAGQDAAATVRVTEPTRVGTGSDWSHVVLEQSRGCGLRTDGRIFCWGLLGYGNDTGMFPTGPHVPTELAPGTAWVDVDTDVFHTCAVSETGELWCEGRSIEGQLGFPTGSVLHAAWQRVAPEITWASVDVGRFHTCAEDVNRRIYCTGQNGDGQVGVGTTDRVTAFTAVLGQ